MEQMLATTDTTMLFSVYVKFDDLTYVTWSSLVAYR